MKKLIVTIILSGIFTLSYADDPHIIPAQNCPVGMTCCPELLVCKDGIGCGESGIWTVSILNHFDGTSYFINATKEAFNQFEEPAGTYDMFECEYHAIGNPDAIICLDSPAGKKFKLSGSGWNTTTQSPAGCTGDNPLICYIQFI